MKTQDILARVNDAMAPYAAIERATDSRSYNADSIAFDMKTRLASLAAELEAQLRLEIAASKGTVNATRTITAMLNQVKRADMRPSLMYAWEDADGRQCACDGFRAFRLREHLPLEPRPSDAADPIDLTNVFPRTLDNYAKMPMPSANEVKAFIAVERAKWTGKRNSFTAYWDFGEGKPAVNAQYLLDMIAVFPDAAEAFYHPSIERRTAIIIQTERGDALLMPAWTTAKADWFAKKAKAAEEAQRAEREEVQRRKFNADVLNEYLKSYAEKSKADPTYSLTPDQFADMAQYAA